MFLVINDKETKTIKKTSMSLSDLQSLVGTEGDKDAYIEIVRNVFSDRRIAIAVDEEGLLKKLPLSFVMKGCKLVGQIVFFQINNEEDIIGLSQKQIGLISKESGYEVRQ